MGIDGQFIDGGTPGVIYDSVAYNSTGALTPVTADQVHFVVVNNRSGAYTGKQIGRNSYSNPGITRNDLAIQKGFGTGLFHLERGQFIIRVEAQNLGNHNDRGTYLDTNVLDYGTGPTSFDEQSLARGSGTDTTASSAGRSLVLWAKFAF